MVPEGRATTRLSGYETDTDMGPLDEPATDLESDDDAESEKIAKILQLVLTRLKDDTRPAGSTKDSGRQQYSRRQKKASAVDKEKLEESHADRKAHLVSIQTTYAKWE